MKQYLASQIEDSSHLVNRINVCSLWSWLKHFLLQGSFFVVLWKELVRIKWNCLHVWSQSKTLQNLLLGWKPVFMFVVSLCGNVGRSFILQLLIWTNMFPHWDRLEGKYYDPFVENIFYSIFQDVVALRALRKYMSALTVKNHPRSLTLCITADLLLTFPFLLIFWKKVIDTSQRQLKCLKTSWIFFL